MINFPNISPTILSIGPVAISWYSLAYISGILFGWYYSRMLSNKYRLDISSKHLEDFITYAIFGIIVGGRLGYVLLYHPEKYFTHPIEILKTYEGGMSFHGGVCGIIISSMIFCKRNKIPFLLIADLVATSAPVGIFFGRIANFINAELYGRVTDVSWAVIFPYSDGYPRHPSQLYEALLEGLVLFIIIQLNKQMLRRQRGFIAGLFVVLYSIFRFCVEFFREPDAQLGFVLHNVTMGQLLSVAFFIFGCLVVYKSYTLKNKANDY